MGAAENSQPSAKTFGTPFEPGKSGNPGGRPKGIAKLARELTGDGKEALKVLAAIMTDRSAGRNERITAAKELLDRGFGKAAAYAPVEGEDPLGLTEGNSADAFASRVLRLVDSESKAEDPKRNGRKPRAR